MTRNEHYPDPDVRERNTATVRKFLRLLEEKDIDSWIELWADDAFQFYPFGEEMFPPQLRGKHDVHEQWKRIPDMFDKLSFQLREAWAADDTVIAQFDGDCVMTGGRPYRNSYIAVFRFTPDGSIREYWEYFDPIKAGVEFGLAEVSYPNGRAPAEAT